MSNVYQHRYGATFGGKHSFRDYGLLPVSPPIIEAPPPKLYTVDIPGMNGVLDLSEALTNSVIYNMRSGRFEYIYFGPRDRWYYVYKTLVDDLHGKVMQVVLDEEPDMIYTGRLSVSNPSMDGRTGKFTLTIEGTFNPWPTAIGNTGDDWLWDPFNFETGTTSTPDPEPEPEPSGTRKILTAVVHKGRRSESYEITIPSDANFGTSLIFVWTDGDSNTGPSVKEKNTEYYTELTVKGTQYTVEGWTADTPGTNTLYFSGLWLDADLTVEVYVDLA